MGSAAHSGPRSWFFGNRIFFNWKFRIKSISLPLNLWAGKGIKIHVSKFRMKIPTGFRAIYIWIFHQFRGCAPKLPLLLSWFSSYFQHYLSFFQIHVQSSMFLCVCMLKIMILAWNNIKLLSNLIQISFLMAFDIMW